MAFKCSFCGVVIPQGTGKLYAKNDGKVLYFCTRRCEKHMIKYDRKPRATRWTLQGKIARGKAKVEE